MVLNKQSMFWELRNFINPERITEVEDSDKVEGSFIEVSGDRIYINGQLGRYGASAKDFTKALNKFPEDAPIKVIINSEGGSVLEGLSMYNQLLDRKNVTTYVNSVAASMAATLMLAGNERLISKTGMVMVHRTMTISFGNRDNLADDMERLDKMDAVDIENYMDRIGIKKEEIEKLVKGKRGEGTWLTAKEAVKYGLATKIVDNDDENFERVFNVERLYGTKIPDNVTKEIKKNAEVYEQRKIYLENVERLNALL